MSGGKKLLCFKTYDVRGKIGEELNEGVAYRIGRATSQFLNAKIVVLGFDARQTSPSLAQAVAKGACDAGANVLDIGLSGTEEIYAAVSAFNADAGIVVTASHNPIDYNGMKIVKKASKPLTMPEFTKIKNVAEGNNFVIPKRVGSIVGQKGEARQAYIDKILGFIDLKILKPLKIVINSGNGAAGPTIDALNHKLKNMGVKTNFVYLHHEPDSSFPNGIPNPLIKENRSSTADAVIKEKADFGVAFDGDFDRCFLFDHRGKFVSGEFVVGLLAKIFLLKEEKSTIVSDPRIIWNTTDIVRKCDGSLVTSKTGHAFMKATMRDVGAIYGGEISAHHYFKDFSYCDSGMIPWLMVWQLLSEKEVRLSKLISDRKSLFPSSGELNFTVPDAENCIKMVKSAFAEDATVIDEMDGLSISFENWRFNLRRSNTEPLVRLNLETRGDQFLLAEKTKELKNLIERM